MSAVAAEAALYLIRWLRDPALAATCLAGIEHV